jgi:hypothetical protein
MVDLPVVCSIVSRCKPKINRPAREDQTMSTLLFGAL